MSHPFGGNWTVDKLDRVREYLAAYRQALKNQRFKVTYIDAFAGTGYVTPRRKTDTRTELLIEELREVAEGSARIALQVEPRFDKYIFIERKRKHVVELEKLKDEFPHLRDDILIKKADANEYIIELCTKRSWANRRAVMFLDPYGMQVSWQTITAIASTKAIDLWLLFPLGSGVNRLTQRDANIPPARRRRLDDMFGTTDWFEAFYRPKQERGLFDDSVGLEKVANFDSIAEYFVERLKTVFPHVAKNPLQLFNSSRNPLYLLCFAAANERGGEIAVRIAQHILRKR